MIEKRYWDSVCLACGQRFDGISQVTSGEEALPEDGDVGVCWKCGHIGVYDLHFNIVPARNLDEKLRVRQTAHAMLVAVHTLHDRGVETVNPGMIAEEMQKFL